MIWLGILILLVLGLMTWELISIHTTFNRFRHQWMRLHRKELAEGEQWETAAIKNDLMFGSKVKTLDERISG